jgi:bifunctional isochorismate lyase/aryl carrier protein
MKNTALPPFTLDRMRQDIADILHEDPADIGDDDNLIELGLDSMRMMTLSSRWNEAGVYLEFSELASTATLNHWWTLAERILENSADTEKRR